MGLTAMGQPLHTVRLWLRLGRVSNLPTVWTNTLTGVVLAGGSLQSIQLPMLLIAFTLFYTGGMFLNDAYDREHDRRSRPDRPIPAGLISAHTVFAMGYGMLTIASLIVIGVGRDKGWASAASAAVLAGAIVAYDIHHKSNPCGPWIMALCRAFIYTAAASMEPSSRALRCFLLMSPDSHMRPSRAAHRRTRSASLLPASRWSMRD
jgi:4-hydroxybenzoate polyprenyltransferase